MNSQIVVRSVTVLKRHGRAVFFAAVLVNAGNDGRSVVLRTIAESADGTNVGGIEPVATVIPPGAEYAYSGVVFVRDAAAVARVEIRPEGRRSRPSIALLPQVTDVRLRLEADPVGSPVVTARVHNNTGLTLASDAWVYAVMFDDREQIVGGSSGILGEDVRPGGTVEVSADYGAALTVPVRLVQRVAVTVDPTPA